MKKETNPIVTIIIGVLIIAGGIVLNNTNYAVRLFHLITLNGIVVAVIGIVVTLVGIIAAVANRNQPAAAPEQAAPGQYPPATPDQYPPAAPGQMPPNQGQPMQ